MKKLHIITPVKDSLESSLQTMRAVCAAVVTLDLPYEYTVYNDFSTPENTARLHEEGQRLGVKVQDLSELTATPSPNYLFVLRWCQAQALAEEAALLIIESDVTVGTDTIRKLVCKAQQHPDCGIAAAVTVNEQGEINYPYLYAKKWKGKEVDTRKHCSFCCSLLMPALLSAFDFTQLDDTKNWFDVTISHESLAHGLHNYLFCNLPVLHAPHSSRPWKQLKYTNPLKYYWLKWTKGFDKI